MTGLKLRHSLYSKAVANSLSRPVLYTIVTHVSDAIKYLNWFTHFYFEFAVSDNFASISVILEIVCIPIGYLLFSIMQRYEMLLIIQNKYAIIFSLSATSLRHYKAVFFQITEFFRKRTRYLAKKHLSKNEYVHP